MKLTLRQSLQACGDFWRLNRWKMKSYLIQDGEKHPFAVICPGGGYGMVCSFLEGEPYARQLNAKGISAFVLYYSVKSKAKCPAPQDDLARAVREILAHSEQWNLDTGNYSIWGSSAGGHLAASFGTKELGYARYDLPAPGALILCYPVVTMGELTHAGSRDNFLGKNPSEEMIHKGSIECHIMADYPRTFVWCGTVDSVVSPENSRRLAAALEEAGVSYQFREYPGVDHGVGLGKGTACEGWFEEAIRFWRQQV